MFDRYKGMVNMIKQAVDRNIKPSKQKFFANLKKTTHPRIYRKACKVFMERYLGNDRSTMRYFLYKWRTQCKNYEIYELKLEVLKFLLNANDNRKNLLNKAKSIRKWVLLVYSLKYKDHSARLKRVSMGMDKINRLYTGREVDFFLRLHKLMILDHRPKFLRRIIESLAKPRGTVRDYFNRWRRINDVLNTRYLKAQEKKLLDLYNITKFIDKIHSMFSNKYLKDGFFNSMNKYGREKILLSLLNGTSKYHKRRMRPYFSRWRTRASKLAAKELAQDASSRFMTRTKKYRTLEKLQNLLRNRFNTWKMNARDITNYLNKCIPEAVKHLKKHHINTNAKPLLDNLKGIAHKNKKQRALRAMPPKRAKCEGMHMKKYFDIWKKQTTRSLMKDMANKLKYNQLKHIIKLLEPGLQRYFLLWNIKSKIVKTATPIEVAAQKIRNTMIKNPFKKFIKIADMKNLEIPRGLSTQGALVLRKPNVAKSIILRNIASRPYWKKWIKNAGLLKEKENAMNKFRAHLRPIFRDIDKFDKRRAFNTWKDKVRSLDTRDRLKEAQLKIMKLFYGQHAVGHIKRYFIRWRNNCSAEHKKLEAVEKACNKLRMHSHKKVMDQIHKCLLRQSKFDRVRAMLVGSLRNNDKGNLAYCFNKWKRYNNKMKETAMKLMFLKNLTRQKDFKNEEYRKNRLHETL